MVSLESDARFVFELEKEWVLCHLIKKLDGEHEVPEFVLHVHVVDTELSTDLNLDVLKRLMRFPFCH